MTKKIIQLRGPNSCGKTTALRQYICEKQMQCEKISIIGKEYQYQTDGKRIVISRMMKNGLFSGADGYIKDREELKYLIDSILRKKSPNLLVFEGLIFVLSFRLATDIAEIGRRYGYSYHAICLTLPFELELKRLYERNGGKPINEYSLLQKEKQNQSAYSKLKRNGYNVKMIDTSNIKIDDMYKIIEDEENV